MALDMTTIGDTAVALVAALFGGAGVKLLDKVLSKRNEYFIESTKIREELKEEIIALKTERDEAIEESDTWREKYWTQIEESVRQFATIEEFQTEIRLLKNEVKTLKTVVISSVVVSPVIDTPSGSAIP